MKIGDICLLFIYIYLLIIVRETSLSNAGTVLRKVGGVKSQPFFKHSNHWIWALKCFKKKRALWRVF